MFQFQVWEGTVWDAMEKNTVYFQASCECSGSFWFVCSYILTNGPVARTRFPNLPHFRVYSWHGNLNFRWHNYFWFRSSFYFRNSDGTSAFPCTWPSDQLTMAEVGSVRLIDVSLRVSDRFPGALERYLTRSAGRCDFPYLMVRFPWPLVRPHLDYCSSV